jgi:hypothetical protein
MSAGPLRRVTAMVGLLALAPIAGMILYGTLSPEEAALRAVLVVGAVVLVGNLARVVLEQLLERVEKDLVTAVPDDGRPMGPGQAAPSFDRRRSTDRSGGQRAAGSPSSTSPGSSASSAGLS